MKTTKRQRKANSAPNAAVQYSFDHGKSFVIAGTSYVGRPAIWHMLPDPKTGIERPQQTQLGVPFVRVDR